MEKDKALTIWKDAWCDEIHKTDYALKRISSAKSAKLTPIKIDYMDFYGYFQGSSGRYETFLDSCPCGDFRRSKLPCKHIYRLAMELELMDNADVKKNANAIVTPKNERVSLQETIDLVESLSENAQHKLCNIAASINSTSPTCRIQPDANIDELINSGIIVNANPEKFEINFGRKNEIIKLLDEQNIDYDKKAKKSILEELCIKYIPEKAIEVFGKYIYVSIPTKYSAQKIHYYLHRKYDYPNQYFVEKNKDGHSLSISSIDLPDDDISDQLIKRGYYIRKKEESFHIKVDLGNI